MTTLDLTSWRGDPTLQPPALVQGLDGERPKCRQRKTCRAFDCVAANGDGWPLDTPDATLAAYVPACVVRHNQ